MTLPIFDPSGRNGLPGPLAADIVPGMPWRDLSIRCGTASFTRPSIIGSFAVIGLWHVQTRHFAYRTLPIAVLSLPAPVCRCCWLSLRPFRTVVTRANYDKPNPYISSAHATASALLLPILLIRDGQRQAEELTSYSAASDRVVPLLQRCRIWRC